GVKVIVATIDCAGHYPIFEIEVRGVAAGDAPARVPDVGATAQAAHHAAGDRSDEIEVVRSLAPQDAAAEFGHQLFGGTWAVEPIVETPAVDHAEPAEFAGARHLAQAQHARLEAMFDVDAQQYAVALRGGDHLLGSRDVDRHRLLDEHVLLVLQSHARVFGVEPVRRRNVNEIDTTARA